ncbi:ImmA/IrrE family metallo-endopeptidase [Clostridium sporogenes]|uniref:ImmA/IrrE family metallo-endopeptidase n=1 Tax=Clostridium sporogenes TaxID=1509 RepID=A0ABD6RSZ8_CLOSG|nr:MULTISPECIES: ImmA/IrrE family metallo-endopeptidase [Clostridium]OSB16727.1 ImmA/IrrE family metallo-endopeptidase [Clostridium sporogenes]QDY21957.1 ImmA/IrrE family metallo-endopeptidase [Clostridium botulinum]
MEAEEIIWLAQNIKNKHGKDPIKICTKLGMKINYINLKPNLYPAYTLRIGELPIINLNEHFTLKSQCVLCAHELGHALMHDEKLLNQFGDEHNGIEEFEANLFAVALLFEQDDLNIDISNMDDYLLKGLLDMNIKLKV